MRKHRPLFSWPIRTVPVAYFNGRARTAQHPFARAEAIGDRSGVGSMYMIVYLYPDFD